MYPPHDPDGPDNDFETELWPAPAGSTPILDIKPPRLDPPRLRSRRRALALGVVAVLTVAGGTVGGALAGRNDQPAATATTTAPSNGGFNNAAVVVPATPAKQDVSTLISSALPGVVSISVELNGGQGAGTGFVISSDGEIATNAHVVADASKIDVKFADGSTASAKVLGVDRTDDLAVIKVDKVGLKSLSLGKSSEDRRAGGRHRQRPRSHRRSHRDRGHRVSTRPHDRHQRG